jgi:hypothetical protein
VACIRDDDKVSSIAFVGFKKLANAIVQSAESFSAIHKKELFADGCLLGCCAV